MGNNGVGMSINVNELDDIHCDNCNGVAFGQLYQLKYLPGFMSPDGTPGVTFFAKGFQCVACGKPFTIQELAQRPLPKIITPVLVDKS